MQKPNTSRMLAAFILEEINRPMKHLNYNLYFLKNAFSDLDPLLKTFDFNSQNSNKVSENVKISKSDFEYLINEISTAIDQSLEGMQDLFNMEKRLIDIIR